MKISKRESLTRIIIVLLIIIIIVGISVITEKRSGNEGKHSNDTILLFNGEDLNDWEIVLKTDSIYPENTFYVQDESIFSTGQPYGYIRTKEKYSDYQLLVEWRWPEEPGNSGVFLHINEDKIWPVCLECQLKSGSAGDFVAFPGFTFNEHLDKDKWSVQKFNDTHEKLAGEWNQYDIRVNGDSVSIYVNGLLQNTATGTTLQEGFIALQSEGAPIQFRNVMLIKK